MPDRDVNLQLILDLSAGVMRERASPRCAAAAERVFSRLGERTGPTGAGTGAHLPFCRHALDGAYSAMAACPSPLPELAAAFAAVERGLSWARRSSSTPANQPFHDGHANAMLIGPGGLEQRDDVWVGATVMALVDGAAGMVVSPAGTDAEVAVGSTTAGTVVLAASSSDPRYAHAPSTRAIAHTAPIRTARRCARRVTMEGISPACQVGDASQRQHPTHALTESRCRPHAQHREVSAQRVWTPRW